MTPQQHQNATRAINTYIIGILITMLGWFITEFYDSFKELKTEVKIIHEKIIILEAKK